MEYYPSRNRRVKHTLSPELTAMLDAGIRPPLDPQVEALIRIKQIEHEIAADQAIDDAIENAHTAVESTIGKVA